MPRRSGQEMSKDLFGGWLAHETWMRSFYSKLRSWIPSRMRKLALRTRGRKTLPLAITALNVG